MLLSLFIISTLTGVGAVIGWRIALKHWRITLGEWERSIQDWDKAEKRSQELAEVLLHIGQISSEDEVKTYALSRLKMIALLAVAEALAR